MIRWQKERSQKGSRQLSFFAWMKTMQIIEIKTEDLIPYAKNPRKNDNAVGKVAESIREFGFKVPCVITRENEIVTGHTRVKAAMQIGMETVPCVIADDLTPEQIKAFRLADNKTAEFSEWDPTLLFEELQDVEEIDMSLFGFPDFFNNREETDLENESEAYQEFVKKFEQKKTTDDCYTPDWVYEAVAEWVAKEYHLERKNFVRPFFPGGDYQRHKYKPDAVVVDNPPFSILSEIEKFYSDNGIKYFLFAPGLTCFNKSGTAITAHATIEYENGAIVRTSFITNLEDEDLVARTAPELHEAVEAASKEAAKEKHKEQPKYSYPDHVITAAMMGVWSQYGIDFSFRKSESMRIRELDAQKETGKTIFGDGYLLSNAKAAEKAAAEKAAAEKAAAEKAAAEKAAATRWELSERELELIKGLG